VQAFNQ